MAVAFEVFAEEAAGGDLVPFCPAAVPPPPPPPLEFLTSLSALAPKLIRLAKGVVGVLPAFGSRGLLSSSIADSSIEPLLAELILSCRPRKEL